MWDNIGKVRKNKDDMEFLPAHRQDGYERNDKSISSSMLLNVDFSSSMKGLFSGRTVFMSTNIIKFP